MEFIIDFIGINDLPTQVLCLIVLLLISLKDVHLSQNLKVGLLYIASFIMIFAGWVEVWLGIFFLLLSEFALLEIFTSDVDKKTLFPVHYKLFDCLYKLLVEYYFLFYLASILVMVSGNSLILKCQQGILHSSMLLPLCGKTENVAALVVLVAVVLLVISIMCILRMKFETKPVTDIISSLMSVDIYSVPHMKMGDKFNMLIEFEDRTFMERKHSHTVLSPSIMRGIFKYVNLVTFKRPFSTFKKVFSRGYGTIEMQLIRNVGVSRGYDICKIRRKFFELVYSQLVFSSHGKQFVGYSISENDYKFWILWCYIQKVPVKFNRRFFPKNNSSTSEQIFRKSFEDISMEEFFVWCISLEFFALIGPKTIGRRQDLIANYNLDYTEIESAKNEAYKVV